MSFSDRAGGIKCWAVRVTIGVSIAVLSNYALALAACPDLSQVDVLDDPFTALEKLRLAGELGDSGCSSNICNRVADWEKIAPDQRDVQQAGELMDVIRKSALMLPEGEVGVTELNQQLAEWQVRFATSEVIENPTGIWQIVPLVLFEGTDFKIDYSPLFDRRCPDSVSQCELAFRVAACALSHAVLERRLLVGLLDVNRERTVEYLKALDARWDSYQTGGRSLYPWELWANGEIYRRRVENRGFVEPPNWQLTLMHPDVAYEYLGKRDNNLETALVLELVGWYQWRWGGKRNAEIVRPLGGAVILSWDGSDDDEFGYGVMFHFPKNWSIGATTRRINGSNEYSILVSLDFGKFLTKEQSLRTKLMNEIEDAVR